MSDGGTGLERSKSYDAVSEDRGGPMVAAEETPPMDNAFGV